MGECPICTQLVKVCEKLGDGESCKKDIEDVKKDKITAEEMIDKIGERFGKDKFKKTWDDLAQKEE